MNIRCAFCQTPYTLSRVEMLDALQEDGFKEIDSLRCALSALQACHTDPPSALEMAMPKWRDELKEFEKEMKEHPQQARPRLTSTTEPASVAETDIRSLSLLPLSPKPKARYKIQARHREGYRHKTCRPV